ncbi:glycine zipper 2TM domain-containing protein [Halomonas sp. CS7]|uniref:Glycine zipper 2TM domain-containing protein n=1 Tax=Halomonas pelophila TaxID=3151122 RepID=A0ABV1N0K2_9GAMM
MKKIFRPTFLIAALLASALFLSGCQALSPQQRAALGTSVGAVAGALVGSQLGDGSGRTVAMALGAAIGGYVGNQFADYLNQQEQQSLALSTKKALRANEGRSGSIEWASDQRSNVAGEIHFGQPVSVDDGRASQTLAAARGDDLTAQEKAQMASLSTGTQCRATRTSLSVEDRDVADGAIWCRTAKGDYMPLNMMAA